MRQPSDTPETRELFVQTIAQIRRATEEAVSYPVNINSIVAPQRFSSSPSFSALQDAAVESSSEPNIVQPIQIMSFINGVRLGYELDNCETLGMSPGCDIEKTAPHYIIIIDYQKAYLSLSMIDVGVYYCAPEHFVLYTDLGEDSEEADDKVCIW